MSVVRVALYVDGFNLYYRLLRRHEGTKWLDLEELARRLFPGESIQAVRYYTARIKALDDPDAPQRQLTYLRALGTLPRTTVHYGYFQLETKWRRLQYPIEGLSRSARVVLPEEKGSDVNLATHLLADGFRDEYDLAAVLTNDADLKEPIRLVQHELELPVAVIHPTETPAGELRKAEPKQFLKLSASTVRQSQFPQEITDSTGTFHKPIDW